MDKNFEMFNTFFSDSTYRLIATGSKAPVNTTVYKYDQVKDSALRVGWIVTDGYSVVDIDNKIAADKVEQWLTDEGIRHCMFTTSRGKHFIFKARPGSVIRNSSHNFCALGIEVDYRTSGKGYIVLPFNDPEREWSVLCNKLDELPEELEPISPQPREEPILCGMTEGGRNDALFRWKGLLQRSSLSPNARARALSVINAYIFDEPLKDSEMSLTIMRPAEAEKLKAASAPTPLKNEKKTLSEMELDVVQNILTDHITRVYGGQQLYMYTGCNYKIMMDREIEVMIATQYDAQLREPSRKEIISKLKLLAPVIPTNNKFWSYVAFDNVVLDLLTGKTYEPDESIFVTTRVHRNYVENAPVSKNIEDYLDHCSTNDGQKKKLLLEMIGDCLLQRAIFQKMYIIYGEGGSGKSTLLRLITELVGIQNSAFLSTRDLESTFMPAELQGKLVNIGDDIPLTKIADSSQIKKLVSGELMMVQRKFAQPLWMANYATLIFTANKLPGSVDRTSGFMRRLCLIDMNIRITDPKAWFVESFVTEDFEYLIWLATSAIRDALGRGELTQSYVVDKNLDAYKKTQSSISEFIDDQEISKEYLINRATAEVYAEYSYYCTETGMKPLGKHWLVAELCSLYYLTTEKVKDSEGNLAVRFTYVTNKTN